MLTLSNESREYIRVPVAAAGLNPTGDPVAFAFTSTLAGPGTGDWVAGSWETVDGVFYARCLVGPGGTLTLAAGTWQVWVRITDNPEVPVRRAGAVRVF